MPFNVFDFVIVVVSQIESILFLSSAGQCASSVDGGMLALNSCRLRSERFGNVSVLRTLRLLRVLKLAHSLPGLRRIMVTLFSSLYQMANLVFILVLLMFIAALLGMEVFRDLSRFPTVVCLDRPPPAAGEPCEYTVPAVRHHFQNFLSAFTTTFVVIAGENWNEVYFDAYAALGGAAPDAHFSWIAPAYFVLLYIFGNTVLLSLFVAIIVHNHVDGGAFERDDDVKSVGKRRSAVRRLLLKHRGGAPKLLQPLLMPARQHRVDGGGLEEASPSAAESEPSISTGSVAPRKSRGTAVCFAPPVCNAAAPSSNLPAPATADVQAAQIAPVASRGVALCLAPPVCAANAAGQTAAAAVPTTPVVDANAELSLTTTKADSRSSSNSSHTSGHNGNGEGSELNGGGVGISSTVARPSRPSTSAIVPALGAPAPAGAPSAISAIARAAMAKNASPGDSRAWADLGRQPWEQVRDDQLPNSQTASNQGRRGSVGARASKSRRFIRAITGLSLTDEHGRHRSLWAEAFHLRRPHTPGDNPNAWDPLTTLEWADTLRKGVPHRTNTVSSLGSRSTPRSRDSPVFIPLLDRDLACCYFSREHPLRKLAIDIAASRFFEHAILVLIIAASICLALPYLTYPSVERRCDLDRAAGSPDSDACIQFVTLNVVDDVFTGLFALEMLIKVLAFGLIIPSPTAYLRDPWNVLDFIVVVLSLVDTAFLKRSWYQSLVADSGAAQQFAALKILRAMRCLRPLRMISRNSGMKMVVNSLLRALPGVANVVLVMISLMLIFGILGVQLFMGRFAQCVVANGARTQLQCEELARHHLQPLEWQAHCVLTSVTTRGECERIGELGPYAWRTPPVGHFDNVFNAVLVLFEMAGLEQWPTVMYHGMDVVGIDMAPRRDASPSFAVFFLCWIFIEAFCVNNLVIGVVVSNFKQMKEQEDQNYLMSQGQREWVDTIMRSTRLAPRKTYKPSDRRRAAVWELVRHHYFELFVQLVIIINVAIMLVYYCDVTPPPDGVGQGDCIFPTWVIDLQSTANLVFTSIYVSEMLLKLIAYGRYYFYYGWNIFDAVLVVASLADVSLDVWTRSLALSVGGGSLTLSQAAFNPAVLRVLKTVRMGRLLRLVRHMSQLRTLIITFVSALPAFINIVLLLFILLFVYAVLGVSLFADARIDGEFITKHANFRRLPMGLLTLFSAVTGENWNGLMHECAEVPGMGAMGIVFWTSYNVIANLVLLNLVIAVILENYGNSVDDSMREVPQEALFQYREEWERLDPEASGNISSDKLMHLLRKVREPLGFRKADGTLHSRSRQLDFMKELKVHDHGGKINFQVLLQALTQHAHSHGAFAKTAAADGSDLPADHAVQAKITKQLRHAFRAAHAYDLAPPEVTQAELQAAMVLQNAYRGHKHGGRHRNSPTRASWTRTRTRNSRFSAEAEASSRNTGTGTGVSTATGGGGMSLLRKTASLRTLQSGRLSPTRAIARSRLGAKSTSVAFLARVNVYSRAWKRSTDRPQTALERKVAGVVEEAMRAERAEPGRISRCIYLPQTPQPAGTGSQLGTAGTVRPKMQLEMTPTFCCAGENCLSTAWEGAPHALAAGVRQKPSWVSSLPPSAAPPGVTAAPSGTARAPAAEEDVRQHV